MKRRSITGTDRMCCLTLTKWFPSYRIYRKQRRDQISSDHCDRHKVPLSGGWPRYTQKDDARSVDCTPWKIVEDQATHCVKIGGMRQAMRQTFQSHNYFRIFFALAYWRIFCRGKNCHQGKKDDLVQQL